jgi:hypothetical protein
MEKKRWYLDPAELTPAERLDRVVELLAKASYLLTVEEMKGAETGTKEDEKPDPTISVPSSALMPIKSGPVPYGQRQMGLDRVVNESEIKWLKRIQELKKVDLSTEKIAKRLNEEGQESRRAGKWSRNAVWRILKCIEKDAK